MRTSFFTIILAVLLPIVSVAQEKWHQNPLSPILTGPGFAVVGAGVLAHLLLTKKANGDTTFYLDAHTMQDAGHYQSYDGLKTSVYMGNFSVIYKARKWMSLGGQLNAMHFRDYYNNTWGFGLRPFVRWYPVQRKGWKLYFEYGAGAMYSIRPFPAGGTRLNFTPNYSIGNEWAFDDKFSLQFGYRHVRISNGGLFSDGAHPLHDSNGFFVGFKFRYSKRNIEKIPEMILEEQEEDEKGN